MADIASDDAVDAGGAVHAGEALERNRDAWKIVEGSMPGNCQGRHAKEVKNKSSRQLTGHGGKGKERTGRGARWPAVPRQRVNPATGGLQTPWSVIRPKA